MSEVFKKIGQELAQERVKQGLTIKEIATYLKLHSQYITDLEQGHIDRIKFGVYIIGYITNYARLLKLDPKSYINLIKHNLGYSITAIASDKLITDKEFIPSNMVIAGCLALSCILLVIF